VKKYGDADWALIAAELPGRNPRQCRERWKHYLSGGVSRDIWGPEESQLLFEKMRSIGPRWTQLAAFFPGRTDIQIKAYWMQNFAPISNLHIQNRAKKPPEFRPTMDARFGPDLALQIPAPPAIRIVDSKGATPVRPPTPSTPEHDLFRISRESSMDSRSFSDLINLPE
jgi:hypothetical protein